MSQESTKKNRVAKQQQDTVANDNSSTKYKEKRQKFKSKNAKHKIQHIPIDTKGGKAENFYKGHHMDRSMNRNKCRQRQKTDMDCREDTDYIHRH